YYEAHLKDQLNITTMEMHKDHNVWMTYSGGSNQLMDYLYRGTDQAVVDMCPLWYFSQVSKIHLSDSGICFNDHHPQHHYKSQFVHKDLQHFAVVFMDPYLPEYDPGLTDSVPELEDEEDVGTSVANIESVDRSHGERYLQFIPDLNAHQSQNLQLVRRYK
ncbi:hypothetical protein HDU76_011281, partial [Blyttiomyces sp. JEL0837]